MTTRVFVPQDTTSCALGADAVAAALLDSSASLNQPRVSNAIEGYSK